MFRPCLVCEFKHMFLVFKQHYTYFHTLFYSYIFPKKTENCCLNTCTKRALSLQKFTCFIFFKKILLKKKRKGNNKKFYIGNGQM